MLKQFIVGGNRDPVDDLVQAAVAIRAADWWTASGLGEHWPLTTDEAAQLLAEAGQFDIDAAELVELVERRLIPRPALGESGELEWSAKDVIDAGTVLEARQQWRPTPSAHDAKKHATQLALEQARAQLASEQAGEDLGLILQGDGPRFDLTHLLAMLAICNIHEGRAKLVTWLKVILEVEHGVVVP